MPRGEYVGNGTPKDPDLQTRWPVITESTDPWDDGCWPSLDTEGCYTPLWTAWDRFRLGHTPASAFEAAAERAGLTGPLLDDRNTPPSGLPCPSLADLARIAADPWPAVGGDAPDLVLGPASVLASRSLRLVAVAGCAFAITEDRPQDSFHRWCRGKPIPPESLRAAVRAVGLAPWALWERLPSGELSDATGLRSTYRPEGPVTVIGPLPVDRFLAARVLHTDQGWVAHTVIPLPSLPPEATLAMWIRHETWMARTFQPGITTESLLRKRPVLVRRALECAYGSAPQNVL